MSYYKLGIHFYAFRQILTRYLKDMARLRRSVPPRWRAVSSELDQAASSAKTGDNLAVWAVFVYARSVSARRLARRPPGPTIAAMARPRGPQAFHAGGVSEPGEGSTPLSSPPGAPSDAAARRSATFQRAPRRRTSSAGPRRGGARGPGRQSDGAPTFSPGLAERRPAVGVNRRGGRLNGGVFGVTEAERHVRAAPGGARHDGARRAAMTDAVAEGEEINVTAQQTLASTVIETLSGAATARCSRSRYRRRAIPSGLS
jgi:hypothetical protein